MRQRRSRTGARKLPQERPRNAGRGPRKHQQRERPRHRCARDTCLRARGVKRAAAKPSVLKDYCCSPARGCGVSSPGARRRLPGLAASPAVRPRSCPRSPLEAVSYRFVAARAPFAHAPPDCSVPGPRAARPRPRLAGRETHRVGRPLSIKLLMPPWPNGQGVGLLIRRLWVRVPQGVRWLRGVEVGAQCRRDLPLIVCLDMLAANCPRRETPCSRVAGAGGNPAQEGAKRQAFWGEPALPPR